MPTILLGVWATIFLKYYHDETRLLTECRHKNEPLNSKELLESRQKVPAGENAAIPLMRIWSMEDPEVWAAFQAGQPLPRKTGLPLPSEFPLPWKIPRGEPLDGKYRWMMWNYVRRQDGHLSAVRAAVAKAQCQFPINYQNVYYAPLPYLSCLRRDAIQLGWQALVSVETNQVQTATEDLVAIARLGGHDFEDMFHVSQLAGVDCLTIGADCTERVLSRTPLTETQLQQLLLAFAKAFSLQSALVKSIRSERVNDMAAFSLSDEALSQLLADPSEDKAEPKSDSEAILVFFKWTGIKRADRAYILATLRTAANLAEHPSAAANREWQALFARASDQGLSLPPKLISRLLLPSMDRVMENYMIIEARLGALQTALAVERFRLRYQHLPKQLVELVPEFLPAIPDEPFSSGTLKYELRSKGYVVYSVGPDGIDDHGKESSTKLSDNRMDVTFIVER